MIQRLDAERLTVSKAFGLELNNFCTVLYHAGSTTREAAESGDPYRACQESKANQFISAPPCLDHRYMHEDIGSGLVPISEFGRLAGIETPLTDASIYMAEALMGKNYHKEGVNLTKMGMEGMSVQEAINYVKRGMRF